MNQIVRGFFSQQENSHKIKQTTLQERIQLGFKANFHRKC